MDRSLNRHSVNTDNQLHLAAVSSFAGSDRIAPHQPQAPEEFLSRAQALLPTLDRFLTGDSGVEVMSLMREQTPPLRDAVREILRDIDTARQNQLSTCDTREFLAWLECAVHVEALVFALFPERWERLNIGFGDWGVSEVFRSNAYWVREGLREADKLYLLWRAL